MKINGLTDFRAGGARCRSARPGVISGLLAFLTLALTAGTPAPAQSLDGVYRLNPGDLLQISVWREEELTREVLVTPGGRLSFPLIGDLEAAGQTTEEIRRKIVEQLVDYIPDPVVTVSVLQARGNKIYVIGKVARPGEYPMDRPLDVMQALAVAGGLAQFANGNRIQILRRDDDGTQRSLSFKYSDVESGNRLESNIELRSGDVIVVP
jgi:polysaccharide export outer membrane protein